jgi:hypothetical protein
VAGALIAVVTFEAASLVQVSLNGGGFTASVLPSVVASLTNDERSSNGDSALTVSPLLSRAAQLKADDMAAKGYFAHTAPDGTLPWHWFDVVGYDYQYAGENLAIDFDDSQQLVDAWMASTAHRQNILKAQYTQIGIGIATGTYQGQETTFVVQFFAKPEGKTAAASAGAAAIAGTAQTQNPRVLGESTVRATVDPNLWQKMQSSPRTYLTYALAILAFFFALMLFLALMPFSALPHPNALVNAVGLVLVILAVIYINRAYLAPAIQLPQSDQHAVATAL